MALVVNLNTYVSVAEADAYLAFSVRASSAWSFLGASDKERALASATRLLERTTWLGDKTGVTNVTAIAVAVGGTGYAVNDVVTVSNGTGLAASAKVATISGSAVATLTLLNVGLYTVAPAAVAEATTSSGAGTGCTVNLTFGLQALAFPRAGLVDREGDSVSSTIVPQEVKDAECELAYELSQDADLELARNADTNTRRLKAGSVEIEYFRSGIGLGRFPFVVQELLALFLAASIGLAPPSVFGTGEDSSFVDEDGNAPFGVSRGYDT